MTEETSKLILSWADKYETGSFVFSDPIQFPWKVRANLLKGRFSAKPEAHEYLAHG